MARPKKKKRKSKKKTTRKMKLSISETRYNTLIQKKRKRKRLTKRETKQLHDSLYVKYCKCIKDFEFRKKDRRGYPICMSSVYTKRGITPPKNAARRCKEVFKKY